MFPLDRTHNHRITLDQAAELTQRYRESVKGQARRLHAGAFARAAVQELLGQPGCDALRIYFAREASGAETFVLVGADSTGSDLTNGGMLEQMYPCPPFCSPEGPLSDSHHDASRGLSLAGRSRDHRIPLAEAAELTRRHREASPSGVHSGAFLKDPVLELLAQPDCAWLRIYNALETSGERTVVLVAADAAGEDIPAVMLEQWYPCPTFCPVDSAAQ